MTTTAKRPSSTTVLLVCGLVAALMIGAAGGAVGASLVTSAKIKDGTIRGVDVRNSTLTGAKIKNSSLTGADVKNKSLTGADVKDGSLTGVDLKDGSVSSKDLMAGAVRGEQVLDGSLTGADIAEGSIEAGDLSPLLIPMWAVVDNGVLDRSTEGVTLVASSGTYNVRFPRDVSHCAYSISLGNARDGEPSPGGVSATPLAGEADGVFVRTWDSAGNISARSFHLLVTCPSVEITAAGEGGAGK